MNTNTTKKSIESIKDRIERTVTNGLGYRGPQPFPRRNEGYLETADCIWNWDGYKEAYFLGYKMHLFLMGNHKQEEIDDLMFDMGYEVFGKRVIDREKESIISDAKFPKDKRIKTYTPNMFGVDEKPLFTEVNCYMKVRESELLKQETVKIVALEEIHKDQIMQFEKENREEIFAREKKLGWMEYAIQKKSLHFGIPVDEVRYPY